jgi:hypothetical protein
MGSGIMALVEAHVVASEFIEFEVGLLCDEPQDLFGVRTKGARAGAGCSSTGSTMRSADSSALSRSLCDLLSEAVDLANSSPYKSRWASVNESVTRFIAAAVLAGPPILMLPA